MTMMLSAVKGHQEIVKVLKQIEVYFQREGLIEEIPQTITPEDFEKLLVP